MRSTFTHESENRYENCPGYFQSLRAFKKSRMVCLLLLLSIQVFSFQAISQVAPLPAERIFSSTPTKFNIDGFLRRQNAAYGDWVNGSSLLGDNILKSSNGDPERPLAYHIVDSYTSNDKIFDGSNRATDPLFSSWHWKTGAPSNKANINHALCYVAKDNNGETWGMFSADRLFASGTTSIDFEFLQARLDMTNENGTSGSFTGTRIAGDLIVTVQFTGNSSNPAAILFYRWSGSTYELITTTSSEGFAKTNNNFNAIVPYLAFGTDTYTSNQFIEGAINISKLITKSSNNNPCIGYDFRTLLVKSKTNDAISGLLDDFAKPIQFNPELSINSATISYASPFCQVLNQANSWQDVTFGQNSITVGTFSYTANSGSPADGLHLNSTNGQIDIANSEPGSYTVSFTYNRSTACSGTATATAVVVIKPQLEVPTVTPSPANCGTSTGGITIDNFVIGATYTLSQNEVVKYTSTTTSFENVAAGDYILTVSKEGSCSGNANVHVANNSTLIVQDITGTFTVCPGATTSLQDASKDGVWSSENTSIATVNTTGVVTGVSAGKVNIRYTVTEGSCSNYTEKEVSVSERPTVDITGDFAPICQGQTLTQLGGSIGGSATGGTWTDGGVNGTFSPNATTLNASWTPPADFSGIATLTLTTSGGDCDVVTKSKEVQVNAIPGKPTISGESTVCQGQSITLSSNSATGNQWYKNGNPITDATGQNYIVNEAGDYSVQVSNENNCSNTSGVHVVTVTPTVTMDAFDPATSTRCQGEGTVSYTTSAHNNSKAIVYSLDAASVTGGNSINAATGAVTYAATWSGTTTITATAEGCNGPATRTHVVTVTPTVTMDAFDPATSTRCQGEGTVSYTTSAHNNSKAIVYSLDAASVTGGNSINAATGAVTYAATWSGTTTITATAEGCNGPATRTHVVTVTPTVTMDAFDPATSTRCQGEGTVSYTTSAHNNSKAIVYSLDAASVTGGNSINAATGAVTYAATWSGTTTITATAEGCNGPATRTHVVTVTPTVTMDAFDPATSTRCQGEGTVSYTTSAHNNSKAIVYSLDAASVTGGNSINAATGAVTYAATWSGTTTITATAEGCNGPATRTHVVTVTPTVTMDAFDPATSTRCQGEGTVSYTTSAHNNSKAIVYSLDAASVTGGNSINAATGAVTYAATWSGTTTITATAEGCNGPATRTHVVTVTPTVTMDAFDPATSTRCQGEGTVSYTTSAHNNSKAIVYSLDAASVTGGNSINAATGAVTYAATWSGTTTITATAEGCNGPATRTHVVTVTPTVTMDAFDPATSTRCQGEGTVSYTTSAHNNSKAIVYSLDAASVTGGNSINAATGAVTYAATWSGTTTITATAEGCNGPATRTHVVTVTPTVTMDAFDPATSTRCQGEGTVSYTTSAHNNSKAIVYSLDAASVTGGNSINAATGAVTYAATWSGTTTITATAEGCNGPATRTHVVTVTPTVTMDAFDPATSTRCQGEGTVSYTTSAHNNSKAIVYSLDAASVTGGNSINAATGAVTYAATWSGTTTITATAEGCNGPATRTHVVTVTPTVTMDAFDPATSTRCQGEGTVSYTTSAHNNSKAIVYSLDAASVTGGNSINAATGAVTYAATWSGTTTITATAEGCNGPATRTHVVTVNSKPTVTTDQTNNTISKNYSDPFNVKFVVTDIDGSSSLITKQIEYKPEGGIYKSALPDWLSLDAGTATNAIQKVWTLSSTGNVLPGKYYVRFTVYDNNTSVSCSNNVELAIEITKEQACGNFTGNILFVNTNTSGVLPNNTTIPLTVVVTQDPDGSLGDLTKAQLTFTVSNDNGYKYENTLSNPVINGDGTATFTVSFNPFTDGSKLAALTASNPSATLTVDYTVNGGYFTNASCLDEVLITISYPSSDFTTGGGFIWNTNSTQVLGKNGQGDSKRNNFGFNVKWNKNYTNLQGTFTTVIRKDGKLYQVKSNKPSYLKVTQLPDTYVQGGKTYYKYKANIIYSNAVIKELKGSNCTLVPNCSVGNGTVSLIIYDNGEPGSISGATNDQIGFTVRDGLNKLYYATDAFNSSNPDIYYTKIQTDLAGGNIQVHVGNNFAMRTAPSETQVMEVQPFNLRALPNPSSSSFNLQLTSNNKVDKMSIRVTDITGRTVQVLHDLAPNQTLTIGAGYKPGLYMVELVQANERKQLKLVKL